MRTSTTIALCAGILAAAGGTTAWIFATEPEARRIDQVRESRMLVETTAVERGTFRPTISAVGTVRPAREVELAPRVAGEVVERPARFEPGSQVEAGALLVRIDPSDYDAALARAESDLRRAEAALELELGRQEIARRDYALLDRDLSSANEGLVLREPQLETARADVDAARAAVRRAELDLERTEVRAPFDALVLTRAVDVGSQVAPGDPLARLVGVETYWVVAAVPLAELGALALDADPGTPDPTARVRDDSAWPSGHERLGRARRTVGELDRETRLARVLVTVTDPLDAADDGGPRLPLTLGSFVDVAIEGRPLEGVVRLPRELLRQGDTTWVHDEGRLSVRELDIVLRDARHAYVREGLADGDLVVTTDLATVVDGAPLRRVADDRAGDEPGADEDERPTARGGDA